MRTTAAPQQLVPVVIKSSGRLIAAANGYATMTVDLIAMFEAPRVVGRAELKFEQPELAPQLIAAIADLYPKLIGSAAAAKPATKPDRAAARRRIAKAKRS